MPFYLTASSKPPELGSKVSIRAETGYNLFVGSTMIFDSIEPIININSIINSHLRSLKLKTVLKSTCFCDHFTSSIIVDRIHLIGSLFFFFY